MFDSIKLASSFIETVLKQQKLKDKLNKEFKSITKDSSSLLVTNTYKFKLPEDSLPGEQKGIKISIHKNMFIFVDINNDFTTCGSEEELLDIFVSSKFIEVLQKRYELKENTK